MNSPEVKPLVKVGDAVLSEEAISFLEFAQEDNNEYLRRFRDILSNTAFAILALCRDGHSDDATSKHSDLLSDIGLIREELSRLEKP